MVGVSWPFLGGLRIPTKDPKQVQNWSVKVGLDNFIENILVPKELGSNSETNLQTGASWSFDKLNKASLFWPCDDIINRDFGFYEKIPYYPLVDSFRSNSWEFLTGWDLYPWCKYWLLCNQNLLSLLYTYNSNVYNRFFPLKMQQQTLWLYITFLFKLFTVSFSSEYAIHSGRAPQLHFPKVNVSKFAQRYLELFLKILMKG